MKERYHTEPEGMRDFYEKLDIIPDYSCSTDGRIGGTLVEFKRNNRDGIPYDQLKDYLRRYNNVALAIPYYSLFVNINQREFTFMDNTEQKTIDQGKWKDPKDLLRFLNKDIKEDYKDGWITEYSIVAYNDKFYNNHLSAKKEDFIKEIENPRELHINPYRWDKTGDMERSILDCLGADALRKRLGAFFTPDEYVKISTEYLRNAIARVPEGYDYIILDRCAGTGNLQKFLNPEELSHCILNTYVYAEWTTLKGLYEGRVRLIIPHNRDHKDPDGLLTDGDALTEEFNKLITDIIEKERKKAGGKLVVIGSENPPFGEPQAEATRSGKTHKQSSWIKKQMKKEKLGVTVNDLSNQFIWSMIRYANEYILFSPIKYWKSQHLFDGKFNEGYLCNRKKFHTKSEATVSLISWSNNKLDNDQLNFQSDIGNVIVKKISKGVSSFGFEKLSIGKTYNGLAYIASTSGTPDFKHGALRNELIVYKGDRNPVAITEAIALQVLPLWVANCYKSKDYTEIEVIMKSGDGGIAYQKDKDFLDDCFIWTCLTNQNKCISNNLVKNELCLLQGTKADKLLDINKKNTKLVQTWFKILEFIKTTDEYTSKFTYGLHQICKDINIKIETGDYTKKNEPIMTHKYNNLNALIKEIKEQLKNFYDVYITPKLFKYELLK